MSNFKIYWQNGTTTTYENQAIFNTLELGARCDEAFASGSIKLACDRAANIPPYTLANIKGVDCVIQSEVTRYQTVNGLYMHNVAITELTSILECFIVGTKAFTSKTRGFTNDDYKKVNTYIIGLMNEKYPDVVFSFYHDTPFGNQTALNVLSAQANDYTFGAGTTLYGALTEIFKRINARPRVRDAHYDANHKLHIEFEAFNLNGTTTYQIANSRLTQDTYNQNQTDYCKYLETEAQNVTDRTHLHTDKDLTLTCDVGTRYQFDGSDTLKLVTSSKMDYITSLKASGQINVLTIPYLAGRDFFNALCTSQPTEPNRTYDTNIVNAQVYRYLRVWLESINEAESKARLEALLQQYCEAQNIVYNDLLNTLFRVAYSGTTYNYTEDGITFIDNHLTLISHVSYPVSTKVELKDFLLEAEQYRAEEAIKQPAYAYYTKGSNEIKGLHVIKNDDFWNSISGHKTGPMLTNAVTTMYDDIYISLEGTAAFTGQHFYVGYYDTGGGSNVTSGPYYSYQDNTGINAKAAKWDVTYAAIINPRLIDAKTDTPSNETGYKPFTRSYNISASLIDYDKIAPSMVEVNGMLGKPERTIEYDITGLTTSQLPQLTNKIDNMYLLSYSIRYYSSHLIMTMNLFKSYSKVAEAIGVAYQYHATNFATDEIVERPCRYEVTLTSSEKNELDSKSNNIYFLFTFGSIQILTRAIMMKEGNKRILYCEAMDQYAWGSHLSSYNGTQSYASQTYITPEYVPYCDNNNEIDTFTLQVGFIDSLTKKESETLPAMPSTISAVSINLFAITNKVVYKDQREKLTFTIEIK